MIITHSVTFIILLTNNVPLPFPLQYRCIVISAAGIAAACGFTDACTDPAEDPTNYRGASRESNQILIPVLQILLYILYICSQ